MANLRRNRFIGMNPVIVNIESTWGLEKRIGEPVGPDNPTGPPYGLPSETTDSIASVLSLEQV
jgi:hypothetical protein